MGLIDNIVNELEQVVQLGFSEVLGRASEGQETDTLLRRFERGYATLGLGDLLQVQQLAGHDPNEETPCKVCKIIAKKEVELAEG